MPEGPEVKIASDYFNEMFSNSKHLSFEIISDYYRQKYSDVFNVVSLNINRYKPTFTIGKNVFLELSEDILFNFHLGMTGGWSKELIKHCHFRVYSDKDEIFFKDVRKFGKMRLITKSQFIDKFNPSYDLLNSLYDIKKHLIFLEENVKPHKSICYVLMNQKYFPGVGNYIKSETLYESKIHPEQKWGDLNIKKKNNLILITQKIMQESYNLGGAELKDFSNPFTPSKFKLKIYGKKYTISNNLVTSETTSDSRKSWFCPIEQELYL
tara:strand:- start:6525 stop:7325 length:801 start_codon:yes stop_codon:yes gene_type:complete